MSNLLVIDFDYFFKNPVEAGQHADNHYHLYDWAHAETPMHIDGNIIWPMRAAAFWAAELELPSVEVPDDFWDRFNIAPDAVVYFADSNVYAGTVQAPDGNRFKSVWLYDAHHDLYKVRTPKQLIKWVEGDRVTCEDWMFMHLIREAELHWRWPTWLTNGEDLAESVPTWIGLDAAADTGTGPKEQFDTVFVCRSGAWVPPWCDEKFVAFVDEAPGALHEQIDDTQMIRSWEEVAKVHHNAWKSYEQILAAVGTA